jgi:hypothetical protein
LRTLFEEFPFPGPPGNYEVDGPEREQRHRHDDIHVERGTGVARCLVVEVDQLVQMAHRRAQKEDRVSEDRGEPEARAHPQADHAQDAEGEVRAGDLVLEWAARLPADKLGSLCRPEGVGVKGDEARSPDVEEDGVGEDDAPNPVARAFLLCGCDVDCRENCGGDGVACE